MKDKLERIDNYISQSALSREKHILAQEALQSVTEHFKKAKQKINQLENENERLREDLKEQKQSSDTNE